MKDAGARMSNIFAVNIHFVVMGTGTHWWKTEASGGFQTASSETGIRVLNFGSGVVLYALWDFRGVYWWDRGQR